MKTMGQAVDEAIERFTKNYPGSDVYRAEVFESETRNGTWVVEMRCSHFSVPQRYLVKMHEEG